MITTGHGTALQILNIRRQAISPEDLEPTGLSPYIGNDLVPVVSHPPTNLVWPLPDVLQFGEATIIRAHLDAQFIIFLKSLGLIPGCPILGEAIMNCCQTVTDLFALSSHPLKTLNGVFRPIPQHERRHIPKAHWIPPKIMRCGG